MDKALHKIKQFKTVGTLVYVLVTVALAVSIWASYPKETVLFGMLGFFFSVIIYCGCALLIYSVPVVMGILGIAALKKQQILEKRTTNIVYFSFMLL